MPSEHPHRRRLLVAIHGILTGQTHPGWTDRLAHALWLRHPQPDVTVIRRHYIAGPFPHWNVWIKNRFLARSLANELRPYCEDGARLYFVTHSNGADIAVKAMRLLYKWGFRTVAAVFIGAAISCDVERSGIRELLARNALGKAFAYCASDDLALLLRATWPYGHLGRLGFQCEGEPWPTDSIFDGVLLDRAFTRWFWGGHSGYFAAEHERETFSLIERDLFGGGKA